MAPFHRKRWVSGHRAHQYSPAPTDGVELVDEDDGGGLLLGQREGVPHQFGAVSDEHLHQLRSGQLQERRLGLRRARPRQQRLTWPTATAPLPLCFGRKGTENADTDTRIGLVFAVPASSSKSLAWRFDKLHVTHRK